MAFQIIKADIIKVKADAIVNSANPEPTYGRGVDSAIYHAAGVEALLKEREKIGAFLFKIVSRARLEYVRGCTGLLDAVVSETVGKMRYATGRINADWKREIEEDVKRRKRRSAR